MQRDENLKFKKDTKAIKQHSIEFFKMGRPKLPPLNEETYIRAEPLFKRGFQEYTGTDPDDRSYSTFTRTQQIERYAKQLKFASHFADLSYIDEENATGISAARFAASYLASHLKVNIFKHMAKFQDNDLCREIIERARSLPDPAAINFP